MGHGPSKENCVGHRLMLSPSTLWTLGHGPTGYLPDLVALNGVVPMPRRCCAAWPLMIPMSRRSSC